MLWSIAIVFVLLWALGLVTSYTLGGFIHVAVVLAAVLLLIALIRALARRAASDRQAPRAANAAAPVLPANDAAHQAPSIP